MQRSHPWTFLKMPELTCQDYICLGDGESQRFPSSMHRLYGAGVSRLSCVQPELRVNEDLSVTVSVAQPYNTVRKSRRRERKLLLPWHYANTNPYYPNLWYTRNSIDLQQGTVRLADGYKREVKEKRKFFSLSFVLHTLMCSRWGAAIKWPFNFFHLSFFSSPSE